MTSTRYAPLHTQASSDAVVELVLHCHRVLRTRLIGAIGGVAVSQGEVGLCRLAEHIAKLRSGLEEELLGMKVGDKKTVKVAPEKGYGKVLEEAIRRVPKEAIGGAENLKVGDMVGASNEGHTFRAVVKEITDKEVVLDFNHPLAGKELTFDVEIKEIN